MKLNYTSLQHPVEPVELRGARPATRGQGARRGPVAGAGPAAARPPGAGRLGGGAGGAGAEGRLRADRRRRAAGLALAATSPSCASAACSAATSPPPPPTAASTRRSRVAGALDAAAHRLGWDAVLAGPGPGIIGSDTRLGHGGMAALDTAHAALALGLPTLLSPAPLRADPRERHRGVSHHTLTVLELLLGPGRGRRSRAGEPDRRSRSSPSAGGWPPPPARGAGRPRRLRRLRPAGPDDGPRPRRGPTLLRRPWRPPRRGRRPCVEQGMSAAAAAEPARHGDRGQAAAGARRHGAAPAPTRASRASSSTSSPTWSWSAASRATR